MGEEEIDILNRENRLGVVSAPATSVARSELAHGPHRRHDPTGSSSTPTRLRFTWARLSVDFGSAATSRWRTSPPCRRPAAVELTTSLSVGLKLTTVAKTVDLELNPELFRKRTVYFPTISASGVGFHRAVWDFRSETLGSTHANRELQLLLEAPASTPVMASFDLRAKLRMHGVSGRLPVLRRASEIDRTYRVAG